MRKGCARTLCCNLLQLLLASAAGASGGPALQTGDRFVASLKAYGGRIASDFKRLHVEGWRGQFPGAWPYNLSDGSPIYTESREYCAVLYLSGGAAGGDSPSLVVEQGTLLGHSSRCLSAGLTVARRTRPSSRLQYHAFDFFRSFPAASKIAALGATSGSLLLKARRTLKKNQEYSEAVWHKLMVDPVFDGAVAHPGNITKTTPKILASAKSTGLFPKLHERLRRQTLASPDTPVEIWSIDSAKSHRAFIEQARAVWPRLRVGSVIHLMDCFKIQLLFFFDTFVASGDVEVVYAAPGGAPWSFVVRRAPLDWSKVTSYGAATCARKPALAKLLHGTVDHLARVYNTGPAYAKRLHSRLVADKHCPHVKSSE